MAEKDGESEDINEKTPEATGNDSVPKDPIGEKGEESSVWSGTEELTTKSAPVEKEETGSVEKVSDNAINGTGKEVDKEGTPSVTDPVSEDAKTEDVAKGEGEAKGEGGEEPNVESGFAIFTKILTPLLKIGFIAKFLPVEKIEGIAGKIDGILSGIIGKLPAVAGMLGGIKGKIPLIKNLSFVGGFKGLLDKDRDIMGVLKNPWVIANGVILVVALSMTVIIVLWFKTSANKINTVLTEFAQKQSEQGNDKIGLKSEGKGKASLEEDEEFSTFLDAADEWFNKKEYQALAFYKALASVDSDILPDESFLDLRIGESYLRLGEYKKAIEALNKVLYANGSSKENKWRSQYMLAECFMKMGDYDKGRRTLYKLIAMNGDFPRDIKDLVEPSYFSIANSYLEEAQIRLAIGN